MMANREQRGVSREAATVILLNLILHTSYFSACGGALSMKISLHLCSPRTVVGRCGLVVTDVLLQDERVL
jgi:hypothetical protein